MAELSKKRLLEILRYWLEFEELFIPEWKPGGKFGSRTPSRLDDEKWSVIVERVRQFEEKQDELEARAARRNDHNFQRGCFALQVMCQCHTGGYLQRDQAQTRTPTKTYALSFLVRLKWDDGMVFPVLAGEEEHWLANRTLLRELLRNAPETAEKVGSIGSEIEQLVTTLRETLTESWQEHYNLEASMARPARVLVQMIRRLNQLVAEHLWSHPKLASLMRDCAAVDLESFDPESQSGDFRIDPRTEMPHFSWRWLETHDQMAPERLGPFFTADLADTIERLEQDKPLSECLWNYLNPVGGKKMGSAMESFQFIQRWMAGDDLPFGRWPANPQHGLCLMQWGALYESRGLDRENPILAVNGPPGTGKTTLLKDIIADRFVTRTWQLLQGKGFEPDWYTFREKEAPEPIEEILDHSIVVVSSNNKAVENISRELPGFGGVHESFADEIKYFRGLGHQQREWGPFCAVLGKSKNRELFLSKYLEPLREYLQDIADPFALEHFKNTIRKNPDRDISDWIDRWEAEGRDELIELLIMRGNEQTETMAEILEAYFESDESEALDRWQESMIEDEDRLKDLVRGLGKVVNELRKARDKRLQKRFAEARQSFDRRYRRIRQSWDNSKRILHLCRELNDTSARVEVLEQAAEGTQPPHMEYEAGALQKLATLRVELERASREERQLAAGLEVTRQAHERAIEECEEARTSRSLTKLLARGLKLRGPIFYERKREEASGQLLEIQTRWKVAADEVLRLEKELTHYANYESWFTARHELEGARQKEQALLDELEELLDDLDVDDVSGIVPDPAEWLLDEDETELEAETRLQRMLPWGMPWLNEERSRLFIDALAVNQAMIELSARSIAWGLKSVSRLLSGKLKSPDTTNENLGLWSLQFLCFPVISTTFASVEQQFSLMRKPETIGNLLVDEAGQTINYAPVGLLQRSKRAIIVGDPMQLEPVVTIKPELDMSLASTYLKESQLHAYEHYLVSKSSAQKLADEASCVRGTIGEATVGLPLRVHRRCDEPMFSIANQIAYCGQMIPGKTLNQSPSVWLDCKGELKQQGKRYYRPVEIEVAQELIASWWRNGERGSVYIITPFRLMANKLASSFKTLIEEGAEPWVRALDPEFHKNHIGTVHTFQGKEAEKVILCLCANEKAPGGIQFVNTKPNLLNVAVTRACKELYVIGDHSAWKHSHFGKILEQQLPIYSTARYLRK